MLLQNPLLVQHWAADVPDGHSQKPVVPPAQTWLNGHCRPVGQSPQAAAGQGPPKTGGGVPVLLQMHCPF